MSEHKWKLIRKKNIHHVKGFTDKFWAIMPVERPWPKADKNFWRGKGEYVGDEFDDEGEWRGLLGWRPFIFSTKIQAIEHIKRAHAAGNMQFNVRVVMVEIKVIKD